MAEPYKSIETRMLEAIEAVHEGFYSNCTKAAAAYNVPVRTLQRRWNEVAFKSMRPSPSHLSGCRIGTSAEQRS